MPELLDGRSDLEHRGRDPRLDALQIGEGSLYPALYRMERKGWIEAEWGLSETNRKVKFYQLTAEGRKRLAVELEQWGEFAAAIGKVLYAR